MAISPRHNLLDTLRRLLFLHWSYLLVLAPVVTDWLETGHLPHRPREFITEIVIGTLILAGVLKIHRDLSRLKRMAETDPLTGLYNRRRFMLDLEHEAALAQRLDSPLTLLYIDVDHFKAVNDRHGHHEGDRVLRAVAGALRRCARRRIDTCYRLGGDEFALLLSGVDADGATAMIRRIHHSAQSAKSLLHQHGVSLSFGSAQLLRGEKTQAFLCRADRQMYASRNATRNDVATDTNDLPAQTRDGRFDAQHPAILASWKAG